MLAGLRELTLLFAPTINSYKRYADGSFAPTTVAWGPDNRTCALRLVGHGPSLRIECRVPGGDVNPYLALAGLIAAALTGSTRSFELPPPVTGNAYPLDQPAPGPRVAERGAGAVGPPRRWRPRPSARTWSTTTRTWRGWRSPPTRRP